MIKITRENACNVIRNSLLKCKNAFTLAEVLITLGIISIVAILTLPSLIDLKQKKDLKASLMKNYSSIQQVLQMMTKDDGVPPTPDNIGGWDFKPKYIKYVKIIKDCGFGASEEDACFPVFALGDERKNNKYTTFNGKTADHLFFDDGQFILADGSLYLFENQNSEKLYISIDVNGLIKSPNRWGYDLFTFQIMKDGKVLPMGAEGTDFTDLTTLCSKSSLHKYNGIACTYKALTDKNYWKNIKL